MNIRASVLAGVPLMLLCSPCLAQTQSGTAHKDSVNDYLCTFAGKCDATAAANADATPTIAAPATKGFRLAAPQAAASPQPAARSARLASPAAPAATPAHARHLASTARPAPVAASTAPRANLQLAFEYNSDRLTPAAQARARTFAQALVTPELKDKRFLIEGHTDSRGSHAANVDLSRRRAQAVADYLAQHGVEASRVEVKGVGSDEPLPGHAATAEANRRVEAVLLS